MEILGFADRPRGRGALIEGVLRCDFGERMRSRCAAMSIVRQKSLHRS